MNDDWTTVEEVLSRLPSTTPDAARAERVRHTCHLELTRLRRLPRGSRDRRERFPKAGAFESAIVGGFCAVYVSLLGLIALQTHGLL
ncbi:MAG TPA: hypothetical protein VMZ90_07745 [Vicinamibacterales bacterium]|nr:hypothetical protein [Vicinamibacterales bacterium]